MNENDDDTPPVHLPINDELSTGHRVARLDRLERNLEATQQVVQTLVTSRATTNRILYVAIPLLLGGMGGVLAYAANTIAASSERVGETRATISALQKQVDKQDVTIGQLLEILLRRGALLEPHKTPTSDVPRQPDKVSLLDQRSSVSSGLVDRHSPKLQNLHSPVLPHWMLLLHCEKQVLRGFTDRSFSSSGVGAGLDDRFRAGACTPGGDAHATIATMTPMILHIPYL